jgi:hypothetical protein
MSEINHQALGEMTHVLTEAFLELGILTGGGDITPFPDCLEKLVPAIKKLKATNAAAHGELKLLEAAQEQMENNLKEQFDQMQVSLIAFVMWKCGRKTLAIDSREITDTTKFGAQAITVTQIDAHTTSYNVAPLKDKKNV